MKISLPIHSYELRSSPASSSRLVNCFAEQLPPDARNPVAITRAPGIKAWTTVGSGPIRGMYAAPIELTTGQAENLYVVSGSELYWVNSAGTATLIGNVGYPARIDMASNTTHVVVVNEPRGYHWRGKLTGTHTGLANNATVMIDSTADFPVSKQTDLGELIGETISNTTDGSSGVITANDKLSITVEALVGGTENDWDVSDAYTIDTFDEITDADFVANGGAGDVEFIDDFLLFRAPDSGFFFLADIGSASSFDALQFANADTNPDPIVGMIAIQRLLIVFGSKSGEIWQNTGIAGVPFERIINGTFEEGCLNAATVAIEDNSVYWVSNDFTVRRLEGITPVRVSTHAIETALAASTVSTLEAFTYDQGGHFFYVLTANEGTWVLDITTFTWHERKTHLKPNWNARYHAKFANKELVGDFESNKIGYLSFDSDKSTISAGSFVVGGSYQISVVGSTNFVSIGAASSTVGVIFIATGAGSGTGSAIEVGAYKDWGLTQRMEWTYMPIYAEGRRAFHDRLEIILETGIGTTTGQGVDPKIMLQYSDDGGDTWTSLPDKPLGALGKRVTRVVWTNLGSSTQRSYRASVSDPVSITVIDTLLEGRGGRL